MNNPFFSVLAFSASILTLVLALVGIMKVMHFKSIPGYDGFETREILSHFGLYILSIACLLVGVYFFLEEIVKFLDFKFKTLCTLWATGIVIIFAFPQSLYNAWYVLFSPDTKIEKDAS